MRGCVYALALSAGKGVGAAGRLLQGELPLPGALALNAASPYVRVDGTQFSLDGAPYRFAGTNAFYAAQVDRFTDAEVDTLVRTHADKGARVLRVFAFSDGFGQDNVPTPIPIQPTPGVFNEAALQRLDLLLYRGAQAGLRFILPLVNYEPTYGGMRWYVDSLVGPGQDKELFYTHQKTIDAYQTYVAMLVNRTNTYGQVAYRDDPTILAWELSNELHTSDLYEHNRGLPPGQIAHRWADTMSTYIKGLGVKQLLSTGEEGYRADGDTTCCDNSWINGGFKGVDFVKNTQLPNVDFATVHFYPDNWGIDASAYNAYTQYFLADRAGIAHAANKPIVLEEYGMRSGYVASRDTFFYDMQNASAANGYAGSLVWQVWHQSVAGTAYDFDYSQSGATAVVHQYAQMH